MLGPGSISQNLAHPLLPGKNLIGIEDIDRSTLDLALHVSHSLLYPALDLQVKVLEGI